MAVKKEEEASRAVLTKLLQEHLVTYLPHRHTAHYNAEQFDLMVDALKDNPNHMIMLMDYGELGSVSHINISHLPLTLTPLWPCSPVQA